ncbi:hypothetical protein BKA67DRAFT_99505 [Truncatella angustata]|uniref:Zn(2)-C6 fungal-type domain-containing protein n=1 Tax=Truncatella angustata TaxID=152316 RepID=A0A9P8UC69_9PEZI|nr:uncharacterized protein BKA67DRAFT_99505 [Truncatella angustata]KAH6646341.1 hypothetical protein BKA67DRAFT_99505 [Truncatella angustata]
MSDDQSRPPKRSSHNASTEDGASTESQRKRRRRVISCQSCQRSKTRCELAPGVQSCRRCQNLRLICSLRENNFVPESTVADNRTQSLEQRLHNQEERLLELMDLVKDLQKGITQSQSVSDISNLSRSKRFDYRLSTEPRDVEEISDLATLVSHSSPIVVLREIGQRYYGSRRQALDSATLNLVSSGMIDRKFEEDMVAL